VTLASLGDPFTGGGRDFRRESIKLIISLAPEDESVEGLIECELD
jgi:hypothetical protein